MDYRATMLSLLRPCPAPSERWLRAWAGELRRKHRGWVDVLAGAEPALDRRLIEAEALALATEDVREFLAREGSSAGDSASGRNRLTDC